MNQPLAPLQWDIFCRVIDNFGDIGVCWRLATQLAGQGQQVRLWVDDASALQWMAPKAAPAWRCAPGARPCRPRTSATRCDGGGLRLRNCS
jgi:hypothetical protein